eukprot:CAMPEP_0196590720 /NCGR_PEP_ID=MMETSP1081-20130531/67361_1 /TAXON_ID=36882 /ORGANISM="Pyramimonas amylifera, Strain CCMP720" /LENGTH=362 /DNA_ID=CAMNT_0041913895 /DNA_START=149 /DNA_END=1237 /DNA_ORIENTATION=-
MEEKLRVVPPYLNPPDAPRSNQWNCILEAARRQGTLGITDYEKIGIIQEGSFGSVHRVAMGVEHFAMKQVDLCAPLVILGGSLPPPCLREEEEEEGGQKINPVLVHRAGMEWVVLQTTAPHPFMLPVYDAFLSGRSFCIVTDEAVEDLNELLARSPGGHLEEQLVRVWGAQIIFALKHIHDKGFVWRDLKLENILVQRSGHIALTDFDLAMSWPLDQSAGWVEGGEAATGMFGTLDYLAPEVIQGQPHSPAADCWAFGVLMYEMLFGKRPFAAWSQERTFYNITTRSLELPETPKVSDEARNLLRELLRRSGYPEFDPLQRLGGLGVDDIKKHLFFQSIDFDDLHNIDTSKLYSPPEKKVSI